MSRKKDVAITELQQEALQLDIQERARTTCPYCNGGSTNEKSLSLYRSNKFTAHATCFRATCDFGNKILKLYHDGNEIINAKTSAKNRRVKPASVRLYPQVISAKLKRHLQKKFYLTDEQLAYGRVQQNRDGRCIFTIFSPKRASRGRVLRHFSLVYYPLHGVERTTVPKAMNIMSDDNAPVQSWYFRDKSPTKNSNTLILVEDIPSALRCIDYCDSVALLGTQLSPDKIKEIKSMKYKNIYLCLDADVNPLIANHIKRNRGILDMKTKFLKQDLKNHAPEELNEFMEGIIK